VQEAQKAKEEIEVLQRRDRACRNTVNKRREKGGQKIMTF